MILMNNRYAIPGSQYTAPDGSRHGLYEIPVKDGKVRTFKCVASVHTRPGLPDLEHVSVQGKKGTPSWEVMCAIKDIFWEPEDEVIQYHPKKSEYVNMHPNVLHMWRGRE